MCTENGGGSPGGARPKAMVDIDQQDCAVYGATPPGGDHRQYLVKFRGKEDPEDAANIEQAYADMARWWAGEISRPAARKLLSYSKRAIRSRYPSRPTVWVSSSHRKVTVSGDSRGADFNLSALACAPSAWPTSGQASWSPGRPSPSAVPDRPVPRGRPPDG